jgi:hypothetical protein
MVDSLRESSSVAGAAQPARRIRLRTATMIAATPVVVGLLMLSSSVLYSPGPEPLDHDSRKVTGVTVVGVTNISRSGWLLARTRR